MKCEICGGELIDEPILKNRYATCSNCNIMYKKFNGEK